MSDHTDSLLRLAAIAADRANDEGVAYFTGRELREAVPDPQTGEPLSNGGIRRLIRLAIHAGLIAEGSHNRKLVLPEGGTSVR